MQKATIGNTVSAASFKFPGIAKRIRKPAARKPRIASGAFQFVNLSGLTDCGSPSNESETVEHKLKHTNMGNQLIYVSIKCEVGQVFDTKYKGAVYEAMKKKIGQIMTKNSSVFTLDKSKGNAPVQYELKVTLKVTRDEKSKPPTITAKVEVKGTAFTTSGPKIITASGGAVFEGPNPKKLDRDAAQVTSDAVEDVMTKKVVPAMTP